MGSQRRRKSVVVTDNEPIKRGLTLISGEDERAAMSETKEEEKVRAMLGVFAFNSIPVQHNIEPRMRLKNGPSIS